MKGITVRQPWAQAIADGHKLVENRSQAFPKRYRGELLIHAATTWSIRGAYDERVRGCWRDGGPMSHGRDDEWGYGYGLRHIPDYGNHPPPPFRWGVVLAVADLVDVHSAAGCCEPWGEETYPPANPEQRPPGIVTHLVLANVRRLATPIRHRGALGLWTVPDDLAEAVRVELP